MDADLRACSLPGKRPVPALERPLTLADIKPRLLGHWGTTPGLNLPYVHLNRLIKKNDLNMIYVMGPNLEELPPGQKLSFTFVEAESGEYRIQQLSRK